MIYAEICKNKSSVTIMRLLELFSGSKSVSKAIGDRFETVVSLDIVDRYEPTITADILTWDYTIYPPGHFDVVWSSPPCTEFSALNNARPEKVPNLALADSIVQRTLEIIRYFNPTYWYLENPQTGTLKLRPYMEGLPYRDFDYCRFSDWGYRKRTRIWTNAPIDSALCQGAGICTNMDGSRHRKAIGNHTYGEYWPVGTERQLQRYAIPARLIRHLFP